MKGLANEKGSTLLTIILFFSVLIIMGTALVTTTAAHVRTQKVQGDRKFAFYGAESGIDEVVALLSRRIQEVYNEVAEDTTNNFLKAELERQALEYEEYLYRLHYVQDPALPPELPDLYNSDGTVNQAAAYDYAREHYEDLFKAEFTDWINDNFVLLPASTPSGALESEWYNYRKDDPLYTPLVWGTDLNLTNRKETGLSPVGSDEALIKVGVLTSAIDFPLASNELDLPVFSIYSPNDSTRKLLRVNITLRVPNYELPITLGQNVVKSEPNILWTKALTTEQNLIVQDGVARIDGNVYAHGPTHVSAYEPMYRYTDAAGNPAETARGIIVGHGVNPANLIIHGEAVTYGDIHFNANNSSLTINGNAYANNVMADTGLDGNTLEVKRVLGETAYTSYSLNAGGITEGSQELGDVVVRSNLELNGESAHIDISGNFTGFSDSVDLDPNALPITSCIVVNTPDLEKTNPGDRSGLKLGTDNTATNPKETVICGIAYLEFSYLDATGNTVREYFSTGESVALRDNFRGYMNWLENFEPPNRNFFDNFINKFLPGLVSENKYLEHKNFSGLFVPLKHPDAAEELNAADRANYFYEIANMENNVSTGELNSRGMLATNIINDQGVVKLNESNYYGYGVVFSDGVFYPGTSGVSEVIEGKRGNALGMFYNQINEFGDANSGFDNDVSNGASIFNNIDGRTAQFRFGAANDNFNKIIYRDNLVAPNNPQYLADTGIDRSYREIILTNNDSSKNVIIGTSAAGGSNDYVYPIGRINGVIVTRGDVYISGDLEFRGTIVAGGNIIINGGSPLNPVTIINDMNFIAKAMAYSDADAAKPLRNGATLGFKSSVEVLPTYSPLPNFDPSNPSTNRTGPLTRDDFTYASVEDAGLTKKYNSIRDMVTTSKWSVVEY